MSTHDFLVYRPSPQCVTHFQRFFTRNTPSLNMSSLLQSLTSCLQKTTHLRSQAPNTILKNVSFTPISHFSTTKPILARAGKGAAPKVDSRITLIRYHMQHPKTPRPLRFSRMRALRHWTIHRAWMLFRRKQRDCERLELERYVFYRTVHRAIFVWS